MPLLQLDLDRSEHPVDIIERIAVKSLGKFDIVYSWGVLHHTGDMWAALANVDTVVAPNGKLFITTSHSQAGIGSS